MFYVTIGAMVVIAAATMLTGLYGTKVRSTSDFLVASRTLGSRWNAAAISGEYLSAASFLGIAGLVLKGGVDALWYPVGFTAGYLALLLFVAAPLRRSGAYTLPDFAEARLGSVGLRRVCTIFVIVIGWLYLVPQMQGAGLTLHAVTGQPTWVGAAVVMVIVTLNIYTGWMRSITIVQAFQYWIKLTALAIPVFVLLIHNAGERPGLRDSLVRYCERLGVMSFARRSSPRSLSRRRRLFAAVVNSARSSMPPASISASACSQTTISVEARRMMALCPPDGSPPRSEVN